MSHTKKVCHCCGAPQLKDTHVRTIMALHAANDELTYRDITRATNLCERQVRLVVGELPDIFERQLRGRLAFLRLNNRGSMLAERLERGHL